MRLMLYLIVCTLLSQKSFAQQSLDNTTKPHSPKTATLLSLAIPGAGQIYNKKNWWWKVPIIYGGGGALAYALVFNQQEFIAYRDAYRFRIETDSDVNNNAKFDRYQTPTLLNIRESYRTARDQAMIGLVLLYALQIVDAAVEAHFFDFDIKDDLTLNIQPFYAPVAGVAAAGIQLNFKFN
jgi:hypothetical protein